jgi:drug/metabolite transporter (DMT)-like permease
LADPAFGGDLGSEPVLFGAGGDGLFGERLDAIAITGMMACAAAVFLVNRRAQV